MQQPEQFVTAIKLVPVAEAVNIPFVGQFVDEDGVVQANEVMEQAARAVLDQLGLMESALRRRLGAARA